MQSYQEDLPTIMHPDSVPIKPRRRHHTVLLVLIGIVLALLIAGLWLLHHVRVIDDQSSALSAAQQRTIAPWQGTWVRRDGTNFDAAELTIAQSPRVPSGAVFHLKVSHGADVNILTNSNDTQSPIGTFSIKGSTAKYTSTSPSCTATFSLSPDHQVLHIDSTCSDPTAAAPAISFTGDYHKDGTVRQITLADTALFATNTSLRDTFVSLVGEYVPVFERTMMQEEHTADLDSLKADVTAFSVVHAYTEKESIVMVAPGNKIWAAVIDWDEAKQHSIVRYFTNVAAWKHKLPKTIEAWRATFTSHTVLYQN